MAVRDREMRKALNRSFVPSEVSGASVSVCVGTTSGDDPGLGDAPAVTWPVGKSVGVLRWNEIVR